MDLYNNAPLRYGLMGVIFLASLGIGFGVGKLVSPKGTGSEIIGDGGGGTVIAEKTVSDSVSTAEPVATDSVRSATPGKDNADDKATREKVAEGQDASLAKAAEKLSAAQFSGLMHSGDVSILGGKNPKVAKVVTIHVAGARSDDRRPDDIQAVRDKVSNGIWSGYTVSGVGYDGNGKINSVTVQPSYPEE